MPGELAGRWNGDPVLAAALLAASIIHLTQAHPGRRGIAAAGWIVATLAFTSPLCALSVALFSARVGQHMILVLVAAPLIAAALPSGSRRAPWWSLAAFTLALWTWHMPAPYDLTFRSDLAYWAMHLTLFGSAIWLWRDLLRHDSDHAFAAVCMGTAASIQMGLLGAVLTLAPHPLYSWHLLTTQSWGLSPIADQQLGGIVMWVPGCVVFLGAALRSFHPIWVRPGRPASG